MGDEDVILGEIIVVTNVPSLNVEEDVACNGQEDELVKDYASKGTSENATQAVACLNQEA